jgi:hypothetical protein
MSHAAPGRPVPEMNLSRHDVWGHFAPMFHLVDVFAVYAVTLVGGRHVTLPAFSPQEVLLAIGERATPSVRVHPLVTLHVLCNAPTMHAAALLGLRGALAAGLPPSAPPAPLLSSCFHPCRARACQRHECCLHYGGHAGQQPVGGAA